MSIDPMELHFERVCRQLGLVLTPEQFNACSYLERLGKRFCVDFGYENAEAIADRTMPMWLM